MRRRALAVVAVCFFLLTSLLPVGVLAKSSTTPTTSNPASARPAFKQISLQDGQKVDAHLLAAMRDPNQQVMVIVQLAGDPVTVREAAAGRTFSTAEKSAIRTSLKAPQTLLAPRITALGGRIIGTMQDAYDGIQVYIKASQVDKLAALSGVVKVHAVTTYQRDNTKAVPYVQAPAAWADGITGQPSRIAVIDTGIDYYHANFGGSGDPADFTYGEAHDTTSPAFDADGTTEAFPSAKVIGGYDFAGDAYDADGQPRPRTRSEPARLRSRRRRRRPRLAHGRHGGRRRRARQRRHLHRSVRRQHGDRQLVPRGPGRRTAGASSSPTASSAAPARRTS